MKNFALFITITLLFAQVAEARRMDRREHRQQARIGQGVRSGELTRKEAKHLRQQQRHIDRLEGRAGQDGVVTDKEKFRIEKAQDRASKNIYKQKHDEQDRN